MKISCLCSRNIFEGKFWYCSEDLFFNSDFAWRIIIEFLEFSVPIPKLPFLQRAVARLYMGSEFRCYLRSKLMNGRMKIIK